MQFSREVVEKFVAWTKLKIQIHHRDDVHLKKVFFREKEIWWVNLGKNIGHEQDGKNILFERPVIIVRKFNRYLFWGVPTSTKLKPENLFYHGFKYRDNDYSAILSQLRPISTKRLIRRIGVIPKKEYETIQDKAIELIKNDSRTNK